MPNQYLKEALLVGSRKGCGLIIPSLLYQVVPGPEIKQQMETHTRSKPVKNLFLKPGTFKMETPETIRLSLQ